MKTDKEDKDEVRVKMKLKCRCSYCEERKKGKMVVASVLGNICEVDEPTYPFPK